MIRINLAAMGFLSREANQSRERLLDDIAQLLRAPESQTSNWIPLLIVVGLLSLTFWSSSSAPSMIAATFFALALHDVGLWAGMRLLKCDDRKRLFLPFLRASVLPQPGLQEGWKLGLLLLLGSLPGVFIAFWMGMAGLLTRTAMLSQIAVIIAVINGLGMLPLLPWEGGRLLNLILFCRNPILESVFVLATSALTVALGYYLGIWVFTIFGVLGVLSAGRRYRVGVAAQRVRKRWPNLERQLLELGKEDLRTLDEEARPVDRRADIEFEQENFNRAAALSAQAIREVHAQATIVPPNLKWSILLLALYIVGIGGMMLVFVVGAAGLPR